MTKFRIPKSKHLKPASPEELFRTLRRSSKIPHLWSHQADLLRAYAESLDEPDVAFELPTGAGKSLVGLLVSEFRRQVRDERVAYLCPTRQLAQQLHRQAEAYGISTVLLTGKQRDYDPESFGAYNTASKVAITTYNGVFNTNPKINNAQCLILDDAHAGENYIAKLWSLEVHRKSTERVYDQIVELFRDVLPEAVVFALTSDELKSGAPNEVGIAIQSAAWDRSAHLREILESGLEDDADLAYSWKLLKEHLDACHIYLSRGAVLIRPLCPPSKTHAPFSNANQRVYMSATLGNGADLERATGVAKIKRLPRPKGWDKQSIGRRLILLPNNSMRTAEVSVLATQIARRQGRILILTTDNPRAAAIESDWLAKSGKRILHADDVEQDMGVFTQSPNAALILTNRYDGIDLPDEACRVMLIDGHPDATNLQEQFLTKRLGASSFLRERVRTRLTQAMGRCTRNDVDFATVVFVGESVTQFLSQRDVREAMHPELQVELTFGIENSAGLDASGFLDLMDSFQTPDWADAEEHLLEARQTANQREDPVALPLRNIVADELAYVYACWNSDWTFAADAARRVCDHLEGGDELKPYRAFWFYLAAGSLRRASSQKPITDSEGTYAKLIERALQCAPALSYFLRPLGASVADLGKSELDPLDAIALSNAASRLMKLGTVGQKFQRHTSEIIAGLSQAEADPYERALDELGKLIGFDVLRGVGRRKAAPDSVWNIQREILIAWEAKSDQKPENSVSVSDMRESNGHIDWVRSELLLPADTPVHVILATPRRILDKEGAKFASRLLYADLDSVRRLAEEVINALASVRRKVLSGEEIVREALRVEFKNRKLLATNIAGRYQRLSDLPEWSAKQTGVAKPSTNDGQPTPSTGPGNEKGAPSAAQREPPTDDGKTPRPTDPGEATSPISGVESAPPTSAGGTALASSQVSPPRTAGQPKSAVPVKPVRKK